MTPVRRSRPTLAAVGTLFAAGLIACGQAMPSGTPPGPSPSPSPSSTSAPSPSPSTSATASASASVAPSATPTEEPSASVADCEITPEDGRIPSDRLLDVSASTVGNTDVFTFRFGRRSIGNPAGPPTGELLLAEPPYTFGPSGLPIEMEGRRVVAVVFRQLSLQNDTGQPVYRGPDELEPRLPALRHAVEFDQSEGQIGWYLGFDGPGCVTLSRNGNDILIAFEHD